MVRRSLVEKEVFVFTIYLSERERERDREQGGGAEGEADSPLSRDPGMGLDPRTPRS